MFQLAITELISEGVTFSVAAGNDNADACYVSPARLSTAITVAATNISDVRDTIFEPSETNGF